MATFIVYLVLTTTFSIALVSLLVIMARDKFKRV